MTTLTEKIWSEPAILELLNITKTQLTYLRLEKDFPCVYLGRRTRIYFADDVMEYIKQRRQAQLEPDTTGNMAGSPG